MPREFSRTARVSEALRRTIGPLIDETTREMGLGMVSVTEVDVSPDLRRSNVFVSVMNQQLNGAEVVIELQKHAAEYRYELGRRLRMKKIPAIEFRHDDSLERGDRLARLLGDGDKPQSA